MKLFFAFLFLTSCAGNILKQERTLNLSEIPAPIEAAFHARHPSIKTNFHLQTIDSEKTYEAHYTENGKEHSERYAVDGTLVEVEEDISMSDIPEPIRNEILNYLRENDSQRIEKVQKVKSHEFEGFEIKCKTKESKTGLMEFFFERNGKFHHQEEVELVSIHNLN